MLKSIVAILALAMSFAVHAQDTIEGGGLIISNDGYGTASWDTMADNSVGRAANVGSWRSLKTVQIDVNTLGDQTVTIQGSMTATGPWFTLHCVEQDTGEYVPLILIAADKMCAIIEDPRFIRPLVTDGAGGVDVDIIIGAATRN
jgi:hypothetical protein